MNERLNMNAYYYHFNETGIYAIDKILSAVADAGNGCHNTEDWSEYGYPDKIQKAAEEAAERDKKIQEALEWACNVIKYDTECNLSKYGCKYCPIKQALEGK